MEIGKRAMGSHERSPKQTMLTQTYRVLKKTDVEKPKGGKQGDGLCRLVNLGLVKQEPVECYGSENVTQEKASFHVIGEPQSASLLCRASNMLTHVSPRGVQSGYKSFPEMEPGAKTLEIHKPGGVSLQQIKMELHSPGSCVTNDSVFHDVSGTGDAEILSTARVSNLICSNAEAKCVDAETVLVFPCGKSKVTSVIEGDGSSEAYQSLKQVAFISLPPAKSLLTALVMIPDNSVVEETKQPLTPASSDSSTLEMSPAVMVTAGPSPSVQKILVPVKVEAVEPKDKLITALDMFGAGVASSSSTPSTETETHLPSRKGEAHPPEGTSKKLMTALDMIPNEVQKLEPMEHSEVEVGCGERSSVQTAKVTNAPPALKSVLLHVKSEPVDNPGETGAGGSLKELQEQAFQNEMSQVLKRVVKQESLNSTPEYQSGVFTERNEYQASHKSSENEHSSSGSEDTDDAEDVCLPTEVQNGAEDVIGKLSRRSQKGNKAQESQKEKEIKPRNSNPGRRIQGGRIYDSSFGRTCHWCRQKTVEHHVKCRECTIYYCGPCLMNRNGENVREELAEGVRWLCPKCRNGCGPGCDNCCNCGPCRKADGKAPTGQLVWQARNAGFENAHDYLVHLETGETPEEIAQRKVGRDWTNCGRFELKDKSENSESPEGPSSSESADEFTLNQETSTQLHEGKIGMKVVKKFVESQKRKKGAMRGALPAKRSQVEASPASGHRDVDSVLARLKVPGQKLPKEKENEVKSASRRVEQKLKIKEECAQEDLVLRNQRSGMRTKVCKREYVEVNAGNNGGGSDVENSAVAKRRKLEGYSGEQRHALLSELMTSRSSLLSPFSQVKCKIEPITFSEDDPSIAGVDKSNEAGPRRMFISIADIPSGHGRTHSVSESDLSSKMRGASVLNGVKNGLSSASSQMMCEQRGMECPSDPQGTEYRMKLKSALAQPFDAKELETLEESARCRKPVQKLRQMRGRIVDVVTEDEGLSYLDHHQDFASKLEGAQSPPEKLALLRGFFFWLQHACMEGAFRPWPGALTELRHQSGDCIETEGPDCQVTAVVLQLDEGKDALEPDEGNEVHRRLKRRFAKTMRSPLEISKEVFGSDMNSTTLGSSTGRQTLIPFQAKKNSTQHVMPKMKGQVMVQPGISYRVVLCLPAPALCKI